MFIITPEIINGMNLQQGETPEFDALWEATLQKLEAHNSELGESCPVTIKKFLQDVNLFECPVHSRSMNFANDMYPIVVGLPNEATYSLQYEIIADVRTLHHVGSGFDATAKAFWLYDEFHKVDNHYEHHVVFSDGVELQIPFIFFSARKQFWFEETL